MRSAVDVQKIFADLLGRINALPSGTMFTVSTLYAPQEWDELRPYKLCLGRMYRREAEQDAWIEVRQKPARQAQQYYRK